MKVYIYIYICIYTYTYTYTYTHTYIIPTNCRDSAFRLDRFDRSPATRRFRVGAD